MGIAMMVVKEEIITQDIARVAIAVKVEIMVIVDIAIVIVDIIAAQDTIMVIAKDIVIMGINLEKK